MRELEALSNTTSDGATVATTNENTFPDIENPDNGQNSIAHEKPNKFLDDIDSTCSTPFVSAPSSPNRDTPTAGFYYSAPASPVHFFVLSASNAGAISPTTTDAAAVTATTTASMSSSFEFDFSTRLATADLALVGSMSSADELFLNGKIRPMRLSTHNHLLRPLAPTPLLLDETNDDQEGCHDHIASKDESEPVKARGRDVKLRDRSLRRRARSLSPLRTTSSLQWHEHQGDGDADDDGRHDERESRTEANMVTGDGLNKNDSEAVSCETASASVSGSSSRSSSVGRSSKRWVFLKEFLYRSKSEGRNNGHKFWSLSFSPVKDYKKMEKTVSPEVESAGTEKVVEETKKVRQSAKESNNKKRVKVKATNGVGKRRVPPSAHELHYTANRAQAEEMRKKTFLPYRQGLLGCLGFSSKSFGAINGFAKALNPVSSR